MRILGLILLLAACSPQAPDPKIEEVTYAGNGRDRLCMEGDRAGFITYGEGDANCSAHGRIDRTGGQRLAIIPDGDQDCRIEANEDAGAIRLGGVTAACAYYCGPGASFEGKAFTKRATPSPALDFAGDPLC